MNFTESVTILTNITVLGHNWFGVLCWGFGIMITFFYFMRGTESFYIEILNAFFCNFALLWVLDLVSVPYNILLYGIQVYYNSVWIDAERWFFVFACFLVFYHNRGKFRVDRLKFAFAYWFLYAGTGFVCFGTLGLHYVSIFSRCVYYLFSYVPFWISYPVVVKNILKR